MHLRAELPEKQTAQLFIPSVFAHWNFFPSCLPALLLPGNSFARIIIISLRLCEPTLHYTTLPACLFFFIFLDTFEFLICFVVLSLSRARQRKEDKTRPVPENLETIHFSPSRADEAHAESQRNSRTRLTSRGNFGNTIEPRREQRNILSFHEQHNQTTVLANRHCVWKAGTLQGMPLELLHCLLQQLISLS